MDFILAAMLLTCSEGKWILDGLTITETTAAIKRDIAIEILLAMPDNCAAEDYTYDESTS